ncbi:MAG TPA: DUF427 domain-containing protein, partial [Dermatophilaceae bacterium]|nr:DUF427 domain-containing protein [Dermatophilaceae bacterium]
VWNGTVLAQSDETILVEGNHYFPRAALNEAYFTNSSTTSTCPWKGKANYLDVEVDGARNPDAAWTYHNPSEAAAQIAGCVAFWKGVEVVA